MVRVIWDRIGEVLFGSGIGRAVAVAALIGVTLATGGFLLLQASVEAYWNRQLYGYRKQLAPLCDNAPAITDTRDVRLYRGTVVASPSALGRYGRTQPVGVLDRSALFVQVDGRDEPLALLARAAGMPPPGTELRFCGVRDRDGFWWPQTGYETGRNAGHIYGEPIGPFMTVKWIRDTGS